MSETKNDTISIINRTNKFEYTMVWQGIVVGIAAGGVAVLYRLALNNAELLRNEIIKFTSQSIWLVTEWFLLLAVFAFITAKLIKWEPMISGSGIPQVEGEMAGYIEQNWLKVLIAKTFGGIICILGGLSLGREGPSIQLGAMAAKGISKKLGRCKTEEKLLITCGASAGLSAAFNAPLAGIMFSLEEIHKSFSVPVLMSVMAASITADFISKYVFGLGPVFHFDVKSSISLSEYWLIIILGALLGVLGAFYNTVTLFSQSVYKNMKNVSPSVKMLIPFFIAGMLAYKLPLTLGGGHSMVASLTDTNMTFKLVLVLLAVKFIYSAVSFGSGAPGGIFFPLLVLGSYIGGAYGMLAVKYLGIDPQLVSNFIILAMCGYFTAIVRAPITGIILISEMTGSFTHLLSLTVTSIIAYVVAGLLKSAPIYESLLERILRNNGLNMVESSGQKLLSEYVVHCGSPLDGKKISEIRLPDNCLLVAVKRNGKELIPRGETKILASDIIVALCSEKDYSQVRERLQVQCTN